ncbi:MAG: outer membrane protein assembly factor BamA [Aestuariivita sp.]|nr:outer membrane protein assembly factor BamA [Aestuariivita sp.]
MQNWPKFAGIDFFKWHDPLLALICVFCVTSLPDESFAQSVIVNEIIIEGNERIDPSTIENYSGITVGQQLSDENLNNAYQSILDSGLFQSIELTRRNGKLTISVIEFPTINRIAFEGNRRISDEDLGGFIESAPRKVFNPSIAERDADTIAEAYAQQGRISTVVTPRIIRRSDNRVDLVFEIGESAPVEVERISFVGNQVFTDRRLRRVLQTKQANLLRNFIRADTLIEDRIEFDKQVLRDFYTSRGYIDFRINSVNAELTEERDGFFLVFNVQEGQQFRFGSISTESEYVGVDADIYSAALRIRPDNIYTPSLLETSIARMERLANLRGDDFLRVEPRLKRDERNLTLNVNFVLSRGERIFVERIDIEGNTTTLDRVIRQQFRIVEGDPFNPREIRASAERIRALGFFSNVDVEARNGASDDRVIIDVDVEEQPTGSLSLGGSYSRNSGFGVAIGLKESNFLGRGQQVSLDWSTATDSRIYSLAFTEPFLFGRDLALSLSIGYSEEDSDFSSFNTERTFFRPDLTFRLNDQSSTNIRYFFEDYNMLSRSGASTGVVIGNEIAAGKRQSSGIGYRFSYDSRRTGLNPNAGILAEIGQDFAGLSGDNKYIRTYSRLVVRTLAFSEQVTLRASAEAGVLTWRGNNFSRRPHRFVLSPSILRGFEPAGVGPREKTSGVDDALGGNYLLVSRFEAEFPLGFPNEIGIRGGLFYDLGNLWNLDKVNTSGSSIVGEKGSVRQVVGASLLWNTPIGPLRFNFSRTLKKETFDKDQSFDFTLQTSF